MSIFTSHSSFDYWVKNIADKVAKDRRLVSYFVRAHNEFGGIQDGFWGDVYRYTGKPLLVRTYLVKDKTSIGLNMRNAVYSALVVRLGLPVKEAKEYCLEGIIEGVAEANAKALLEMEEACLADVKSFAEEKYSIEKACLADLEAIAASMGVKSVTNKYQDVVNIKVRITPEKNEMESIRSMFVNGPEGKIYAGLPDHKKLEPSESSTGHVTDSLSVGYKLRANSSDDSNAVFFTPINKREEVTMKIERPVNVVSSNYGTVNVLDAGESMLAALVREAQKEIAANEDLAEISTSYTKKANELQKIIDLCVKQLDKVAK